MKIRIRIGQMYHFNKVLKTPIWMDLEEGKNIFHVIEFLDQQIVKIWGNLEQDMRNHIFMGPKLHSLLQLVWDPQTNEFYDDVGIEIQEKQQDDTYKILPIRTNPFQIIRQETHILLTPDIGC